MLFEKMFGNIFGLVWLILCMISIGSLFVWIIFKKNPLDKKKKDLIKENYKGYLIEENKDGKFEIKKQDRSILQVFDSEEDCKVFIDVLLLRVERENEYVIIEEDGFYKVKKKDSTKTIRKFSSEDDAINYVKEKERND